jgi:hypothetical protein
MTSLPSRAASGAGTAMRDLKWSPAEKAIARKAFDRALGRELEAVILETKSKAAKIQEPSGLWELERSLTQRRQEIDREYYYRDSILPSSSQTSSPVAASTRTSCTAWAKTNSATSIAQLCTFKPRPTGGS